MRWIENFILGVVSGAMVGALIALLLAPSSGDEMQQKIRDYSGKLSDEVRTAAQEKRSALESELASLRTPKA